MKIAVITPYYKEDSDVLHQCHQSVLDQGVDADHFFVADGFPNQELMTWNIKHISLPQAHADNGNTPRGIGGILADVEGYDFICYLDADNWFHPGHISSLLELWKESNADVCSSFRTIHSLNGMELPAHDADELSLAHIDTSCYLLHRNAFEALYIWLKIPKALPPICDRIFLSCLKRKQYRFASTRKKTVAFRSQYLFHYLFAKVEPPQNLKDNVADECHAWLQTAEGRQETVKRLGFLPI